MPGTSFSRRQFLAGCAAAAAAFSGKVRAAEPEGNHRHVPWLADAQMPPASLPADAPRLSPLLIDESGRPIGDLASWRPKREQLLKAWKEFLGEVVPAVRPSPKWTVLEEDTAAGVVRRRIRYDSEPGDPVEAYLILPEPTARPAPAVVVHHSTVEYSIRQPAGLEGPEAKHFGLKLARRGFVTLCPRNFLWPENGRIDAQRRADEFLARHPRAKGMAKMLLHSQLAVDLLTSLPEVDARRIGAVGHSLGAKEVLYLAAFDDRVRATVSSEGGVGVGFSNWRDDWYLGPDAAAPDFPRDHHELLALAAPRPFLLIGGESADGDRGWPYITAALGVYRLYGEPAPLAFYNHRQGHSVPPQAEERIYEWLQTYLSA